eukprot:gnl/Chilomastix_cuspidata/2431.p1 GENE.gnl/Chilomastix_cuspidata/2431~~gnl/Chilomastix_cuspidata/2431.p1  ORF type:complete len:145 (+),score=45.59 gnl/Chilomastix_cuspidata/2431:37-471(+)
MPDHSSSLIAQNEQLLQEIAFMRTRGIPFPPMSPSVDPKDEVETINFEESFEYHEQQLVEQFSSIVHRLQAEIDQKEREVDEAREMVEELSKAMLPFFANPTIKKIFEDHAHSESRDDTPPAPRAAPSRSPSPLTFHQLRDMRG